MSDTTTQTNSGEVREKIDAARDELKGLAQENEKLGRLSDRTAQLVRDSGVIRQLQPKEFGGYESHPVEWAQNVMELASTESGAGWIGGIVGVHPWELAMMDRQVQEDVWGSNPDAWMASPYAPLGVAVPTDGGYILNGRWGFSSGCDHSDWLFIAALEADEKGEVPMPPNVLHVLVPKSDFTIDHDSWDVAGLRSTGSKDVIVKDAFLPKRRTVVFRELIEHGGPNPDAFKNPLYAAPYWVIFPLGITSAVIGMAEGLVKSFQDYQRDRVSIQMVVAKDDPFAMYALSEAASDIRASRVALLELAREAYEGTKKGHQFTVAERARMRRDQSRAAWRCAEAIQPLVAKAGGKGLMHANPIQRFWRDVQMGLNHAVHVPEHVYRASAALDMDLPMPEGPAANTI